MRPDYNTLLYGGANDVAESLLHDHPVLQEDLIPALINALRRIDLLELKVKNMEDVIAQQDNLMDTLFRERV